MSKLLASLMSRTYRAEEQDVPSEGADTSSDNDWESLLQDDEVEESSEVEPAVEEPPAAPSEAPAPTETPAPPQTPATAQPEPASPPAAESVQQSTQPEPAPVDMNALRQQYESELTQYYSIDSESAARLQTEPENVLPVLAAKVHLAVLDTVMSQFPQRVGAIVQQVTEAQQREFKAKESFFSAYPELRAHEDAVLRTGQMYRAANPKATPEQAKKAIGDFVMQSLGIQRQAPVQTPPVQTQTTQPFVPAGSSGAGYTPPEKSLWEEMVEPDY